MAAIALPRLKLPKPNFGEVFKSPVVGLTAAAFMFLGAAYALAHLLGPPGGAVRVRIPLEEAYRDAPPGWTQALKAVRGAPHVYHDVVRLSERPLAPGAALALNAPPPAPLPGMTGQALPVAPIPGFFAPGPGGAMLPEVAYWWQDISDLAR